MNMFPAVFEFSWAKGSPPATVHFIRSSSGRPASAHQGKDMPGNDPILCGKTITILQQIDQRIEPCIQHTYSSQSLMAKFPGISSP